MNIELEKNEVGSICGALERLLRDDKSLAYQWRKNLEKIREKLVEAYEEQ